MPAIIYSNNRELTSSNTVAQEAKLEGKAAAVDATNLCLQRLYLTDMHFGAVDDLNPLLVQAADVALCRDCETAHSRLQAAVSSLQSCSDAIR